MAYQIMLSIPDPSNFDIDPVTGFLPSPPPLSRLCETFEPWEKILDNLQSLLLADRLRSVVKKMPLLDIEPLKTPAELKRAYLVISFIGQAYIWGKNNSPESTLPECIAIPWCRICKKLDTKPIISYAAVELYNFKVLDSNEPWDLSNLAIMHTFSGGMDEAWFYLISIAMEAAGAPAIPAIITALHGIKNDDTQAVIQSLRIVDACISRLNKILVRMYEKNDAHIFFNRVRPFMNGWEKCEDMPNGVFYSGVVQGRSDTYIPNGPCSQANDFEGTFGKYAGGSAGQSSLIHVLDTSLGIVHLPGNSKINLIAEMRKYMPGPHRNFIAALEESYSIRKFVESKHAGNPTALETLSLIEIFNDCVEGMKAFRNKHIQMVGVYIISQATKAKEVGNTIPGLMARGTGGTDLIPFLKQSREETKQALVGENAVGSVEEGMKLNFDLSLSESQDWFGSPKRLFGHFST